MEFTTLGGAVGEAPSNWWGAGPAIHQYMILSSSNFLQAYMDSLQGLGCPNISPPTVASAKNCQILGRQRCPCESRHNGTFLRVHWSSMCQPQPPKVLVAPQSLLDQFLTLVGLLSHMDDPEWKLYNLQNYNVYIYIHTHESTMLQSYNSFSDSYSMQNPQVLYHYHSRTFLNNNSSNFMVVPQFTQQFAWSIPKFQG